MNDTAAFTLAAGTLRTEVGGHVVRTDLGQAGLQSDPELHRAGVAGPGVGQADLARCGDGVGGGGEVGLPTLGTEARVLQGGGKVQGVVLQGESVVETPPVHHHLNGGDHHLGSVQSLHFEGALDFGAVGVEREAVRHNLHGVVVGGEEDEGVLLGPARAVEGPQLAHHLVVVLVVLCARH